MHLARGATQTTVDDFTAGLTGADLETALRDRIRELEGVLGAVWRAPRVLHLTPTEERLLGALAANRKLLSADALYTAIYSTRRNPPEPQIIGVLIFRVRGKLAAHDITIDNRRLRGFEITPENIDRLNALYAEGERA